MKAKELRVGNYLNHVNEGLAELSGYGLYQITVPQNGGNVSEYYKGLEYMLLTEEWILKLGFEKWKDNIFRKRWGRNGVEFIIIFPDKLFYFETGPHSYRHITYVHQLQNLYFALIGEELIINPPYK